MSGLKLYEIDSMLREAINAAEAAINIETGEIPADWSEFLETVQMERDDKALAVAAYWRELTAEADAVKEEAKRLVMRSRALDNRADSIRGYLAGIVNVGEKLSDNRVKIGWRKSTAVVIDDESKLPETCWRIPDPVVDKTAVKELITNGTLIAGSAHIETRDNLQIK